MLKFYVSCRPIQLNNVLYDPSSQLKEGFKGLDLEFKFLASNRSADGRYLFEIIIGKNSAYSNQECLDFKAIVLEGLQAWSVHEKSLQSAKELAELLTGLAWNIVGDHIEATLLDPR